MAIQNSVNNPTPVIVEKGGTGLEATTAFELLAGGTTATGNLQQIAPGTAGQVLLSQGAAALPVFDDLPDITDFIDNTFQIENSIDNTKIMNFSAVAITTATTRTITMADADIDLALTGGSYQADLSGLTVTVATVAGDDKVLIQDTSDADNLKTVTAQSIADLAGAGSTWTVVTAASQALDAGDQFIATNAGETTFTLPVTASVGDTYKIALGSTGGFVVAQGAGQTVTMYGVSTTTGVAGETTSETIIGATLEIVCVVADDDFLIVNAVGQFDLT